MSDRMRVMLEAGIQDAEITVRVSAARDELLDDLETQGLHGSRVMELSAASTLEVLSTSLATYAPVAGAAFVGVRSVPKEAWQAFGQALTAWINRRDEARVEIEFGDGSRVVVENDRRAVRKTVEELLPVVREQQITRHDEWQRMLGNLGDDPGAGTADS